MTNKNKVLILDIETSPMLVYVWGLKDQYVDIHQIHSDWSVLAWAAKWLDEPASKTIYMDVRKAKDLRDDKAILQPLWELLNEADIVITQNGKSFDGPKLNARFMLHGMQPPKPYKHLDTYRLVKSVAQFTSNKLEYLTEKFCTKYKKLSHKKYPGLSLWIQCLKGNVEAWEEMKKYNIHDVLSTEEFYGKVRSWAPQSMPKVYEVLNPDLECSSCGKTGSLRKRGIHVTKSAKTQRYQCQLCGSWSLGGKIK